MYLSLSENNQDHVIHLVGSTLNASDPMPYFQTLQHRNAEYHVCPTVQFPPSRIYYKRRSTTTNYLLHVPQITQFCCSYYQDYAKSCKWTGNKQNDTQHQNQMIELALTCISKSINAQKKKKIDNSTEYVVCLSC